MADGYRQEVFNVLLAQLLQERGVVSAPEDVLRAGPKKHRRIPDVLVEFAGLRTAIEGEVSDQPNAESRAVESAQQRVELGIAHIGVAVVYPARLRRTPFGTLKQELASAKLRVCVVTEEGPTGFVEVRADELGDILRRTFDQLVKEDVVAQAVAALEEGVEIFAAAVWLHPGTVERLAGVLGVRVLGSEGEPLPVGGAGEQERKAIGRISGLVLINALVFEEILAEHDKRVQPVQQHLSARTPLASLSSHWRMIVDDINYFPIFHVADQVTRSLTSNADIVSAVLRLGSTAQQIVSMRAALRHDLMGRVYHRLLVDAKYLGTYYTGIPAAVLLLKLALRRVETSHWSQIDELATFRIGDLACGTGTLLMAAADAVIDLHIQESARLSQPADILEAQRVLAESVLYGFDVLASAIHLTASTLALRAPETAFDRMNLYSLPLGGPHKRLGSIEFLESPAVAQFTDLFGATSAIDQATGTRDDSVASASVPPLDLCAMNPPFTRSVGGNLLFGSAPEAERAEMQKRLSRLLKRKCVLASTTAGLGSVFVALGDRYVKTGGRMALVLPKTVLSGVAWDKTRELLRRSYRLEYVVASHDPEQWNFSESTDLSEVLLVAVKESAPGNEARPLVVLNLWRNPSTSFEALAVEHSSRGAVPDLETGQGSRSLYVGESKVGEAISIPWAEIRDRYSWILPCAFAQSDLVRVAFHLLRGSLWLPGHEEVGVLPLRALGELGRLGPDRRDVYDGFEQSPVSTTYPAFWGHDSNAVRTVREAPNRYLSPLERAKPRRPLRRARDLWPRSGNVLVAEGLRLNTQRLVAVRVDEPVLSNVWWPVSLNAAQRPVEREKALCMWLNSTLGLLSLLANRQETEGAWIDFKKPVLERQPVLDVGALTDAQLSLVVGAYDEIAVAELEPFSRIGADPVRAAIDLALERALSLPSVSSVRLLMGQEPVLTQRRL